MKIARITAREIFDSRGLPTVECQLVLEDGSIMLSSVPSGMSRGLHEATELRDGGDRLMGKGVQKAVEHIESILAPAFVGHDPDLVNMDLKMIDMDGTPNKDNLGANAILPLSMAICKAQAYIEGLQTYELLAHLCDFESVSMPFPLFNLINGGVHADNKLTIQEFMIMPVGAGSFRGAMEIAVTVFHTLKELLAKDGKRIAVGDEGGFAPMLDSDRQALDYIMRAMDESGVYKEDEIALAIDVAASRLYDAETGLYAWNGKQLTSENMLSEYAELLEAYPICSIEDGLSEVDQDGWKKMTASLGEHIQVVGDDLFATNPARIVNGIEQELANSVLIKPNQVGTVTETLQSIKLCKEYGMNIVVSHRSGETNDTFLVDLAVGTSAGQIKAGGCSRGERIAKYNQLLRIEDQLVLSMF